MYSRANSAYDVAVAVLRRASAAFEGAGAAELSADCANAADGLRLTARGRSVLVHEPAATDWKVDVRHYAPKAGRLDETPVAVAVDGATEAAARHAFSVLELRACGADPALPRPVRFRLWRGDTVMLEVEWL